jgi:hypothetical protein
LLLLTTVSAALRASFELGHQTVHSIRSSADVNDDTCDPEPEPLGAFIVDDSYTLSQAPLGGDFRGCHCSRPSHNTHRAAGVISFPRLTSAEDFKMDTSYLTTQVTTIIGQLHSIFDEIGVPRSEREARETEVC